MIQSLEGESITYNIPAILQVEGQLNEAKLERAFQELINRHESFRTSFALLDGQVIQRVHQDVDILIKKIKLTEMRSDEIIPSRVRAIIKDFIKPFDLSVAQLLRVGLIELKEDNYLLMSDMHHIISDGTSMGIFFN